MALTDNLVAYWSLEENSGARVDAVGANDLTQGQTVTAAAGKVGNANVFPGAATGGTLSVADHADLRGGDFDYTLIGWFYRENAVAVVNSAVIIKADINAREYAVVVYAADQSLNFEARNGADVATTILTWGTAVSVDTWYFFACGHDATANETWLAVNNGTPLTGAITGGTLISTKPFYISTTANDTFRADWDGMIDEVGKWNRKLTADELTWLYNSGSGRSYAEIVAGMGGGSASPSYHAPFGWR